MNSTFDWHYDSYTYLESLEFLAYTKLVRSVIHAANEPVTIRAIHAKLGSDAKSNWTADALEAVRDIEAVGILPTRYRPSDRRQPLAVIPFNRTMGPLTEAETRPVGSVSNG